MGKHTCHVRWFQGGGPERSGRGAVRVPMKLASAPPRGASGPPSSSCYLHGLQYSQDGRAERRLTTSNRPMQCALLVNVLSLSSGRLPGWFAGQTQHSDRPSAQDRSRWWSHVVLSLLLCKHRARMHTVVPRPGRVPTPDWGQRWFRRLATPKKNFWRSRRLVGTVVLPRAIGDTHALPVGATSPRMTCMSNRVRIESGGWHPVTLRWTPAILLRGITSSFRGPHMFPRPGGSCRYLT